jgi:hypothetical protein
MIENTLSVHALADLYRKSVGNDTMIAAMSEQAAFSVAVAEAAMAEAATLMAFAESATLTK